MFGISRLQWCRPYLFSFTVACKTPRLMSVAPVTRNVECCVFLFPTIHIALIDSDCVPVTLFELEELWRSSDCLQEMHKWSRPTHNTRVRWHQHTSGRDPLILAVQPSNTDPRENSPNLEVQKIWRLQPKLDSREATHLLIIELQMMRAQLNPLLLLPPAWCLDQCASRAGRAGPPPSSKGAWRGGLRGGWRGGLRGGLRGGGLRGHERCPPFPPLPLKGGSP